MAIENKGANGSSGFKRFFEQNKSLMVLLPLLLVMLIVVAILYIPKLFNSAAEVAVSSDNATRQTQQTTQQGSKVEVLPQTQRVIDEASADKADSTASKSTSAEKDPFVGPMAYSGYVLNSDGNNIAVLEGNGRTYLVRIGDMLGESTEVQSITGEEVILKNNDRTTVLKLEQKKNSQTVNK